jgi:hypothetical protein
VAAITVLSANWASDAFLETFTIWCNRDRGVVSWPRLIYIAFFCFMVFLLCWQAKYLFRTRTRYLSSEKAEKRKHLVLFLSSLHKDLEKSGGVPKELSLSQDINEDIRRLEALKRGKTPVRWTWEMPLRGIRHHVGDLKTVTLICSEEPIPEQAHLCSEGSISQAHLFLNICRKYNQLKGITFYLLAEKDGMTELICLPTEEIKEPLKGLSGYNFETFDILSLAMWTLLREFKRMGYSDDEIMIDITGGQKPTSVVGASVTINRKIKAQYVQTNYPWGVISYDFILVSADTGRLGI